MGDCSCLAGPRAGGEIAALREQLARANSQRDAAVAIGEAKVAALRELADRLTAELADAPKPWFVELLAALRGRTKPRPASACRTALVFVREAAICGDHCYLRCWLQFS